MTLGEYIAELLDALGTTHPAALVRIRQVVGDRRACIVLDSEAVDISFGPVSLRIEPAVDAVSVDGVGATDSATVLALLDGYLEVTDAILDGQLRVSGAAEDIARMLIAMEILLDASPRIPALQALATRFQLQKRRQRSRSMPDPQNLSWYPFSCVSSEYELLSRLDLLPDATVTDVGSHGSR
jgi:hypothetical protein